MTAETAQLNPEHASNGILIAGHSHTQAFGMRNIPGEDPRVRNIGPGVELVDVALPGPEDFAEIIRDLSSGKDLLLSWLGNFHVARHFFLSGTPFDFVCSERPDLPLEEGAQLVPEAMVEETLAIHREETERALEVIAAGDARSIWLLCPPPPKGDQDKLRDMIAVETDLCRHINAAGFEVSSVPLVPRLVRLKLWLLIRKMTREVAERFGANFLEVPEDTLDPDGFLAEPYWAGDVTHANELFGAAYLRKAQSAIVARHEAGSRANSERAPGDHPYRHQPRKALWKHAVSAGYDARLTYSGETLLRTGDRIASLGSCFAANLVPYLRQSGFHYVVKEPRHPSLASAPADNMSYDKFSAAYGNIYTARAFRQLLLRALGRHHPVEDRWETVDGIADPFRPGLRYKPRTNAEFDALTNLHLQRVLEVFEEANVVIFTLGLTEAWIDKRDGSVFPACPGTVAGTFDPAKHAFHNFSTSEVVEDLHEVHSLLREIRPDVRMILTVSPVPLVATATHEHVLTATGYSKAALRAAAGEFARDAEDVSYFPSFEIITGPQAPESFYKPDRRDVTQEAVDTVMAAFLSHCEGNGEAAPASANNDEPLDLTHISTLLVDIECEEAAAAA